MLVYASTKKDFIEDVKADCIDEKILSSFQRHLGKSAARNEIRSWRNSMMYMREVLSDEQIPSDSGVAIEFNLPQNAQRIDFVLSGKNSANKPAIVIVELKQWETAKPTDMDGVVRTFVGGAERKMLHPSYQAWTYAALLEDFNETIHTDQIELRPCAYLHNCVSHEVIRSPAYEAHTAKAPVFLRKEGPNLTAFIKKYVKYGDNCETMYRIDKGRIRPSKNVADALSGMLAGKQEFILIDDQKLVFETAISLAVAAGKRNKHVLIVEGGPGTGKSVVAINLLARLTQEGLVAQYVSKNSAPRAVYHAKLTGSMTRTRFNNLFKGSGVYIDSESNYFDALIVDEAHRLNEKSGMFQNIGENQIKEIIAASKCSIFFIDPDQRVTFKDIGTVETISEWAERLGATVHKQTLQSQFRCNGSDGYLSWIDHTLCLRTTANPTLEGVNYDFQVFDSPATLRDAIFEKNKASNRARLVAGYCWEWTSKNDPTANDIVIEEHGFAMKWNLATDSSLWIIKPDSVKEIGCIHTCQGLETDYIGVIIGPDFVVRNGIVQTDATARAKSDASIKGFKKQLKTDPEAAKHLSDLVIKNTYRTLMTRGMKGCYVYCTDKETNEWIRSAIGNPDGYPIASKVNLQQLAVEDVRLPYIQKVAEERAQYVTEKAMTNLPTVPLGRTGLKVSKLGYGAMELRGVDHFPRLTSKEANTLLNGVLDAGINYIDTSPDYGYSEQIIGEQLAHRRSEFFLASKCGCPIEPPDVPHAQRKPHDFSRHNVRAGVEQSLRLLKTDYLDVVQFHISPSRAVLEANDSIAELLKLRTEGKLRFIGISATLPELPEHIAMGVFDVIQVPYSVVEREHEALIHQAAQRGSGIVIRGGVSRGVMVKDASVIDAYPPFLQAAFRARRQRWMDAKVEDWLGGMDPMEFMLRWTISNSDMSTTIVGTANPAHLAANVKVAAKGPLPADLYKEACRRFAI